MKLNAITGGHTFQNGEPFWTDFPAAKSPETPIVTAKDAADLAVAYHASPNPDLAKTGISTRQERGLPDLFHQGTDSTHQDSVYLAATTDALAHCTAPGKNRYIYRIDLRQLDKSKFLADEDAVGHCVINGDNWVDSVMCMGTFRYRGNVPASLITRLH